MTSAEANVYLPKPYADELLYSVVARYCDETGFKISNIYVALFGVRGKLRAELSGHIKHLSSATKISWGLSPEEIVENLTLMPAIGAFIDEERYQACCRRIIETDATGVMARLGVNASSHGRVRALRLCAICCQEDQRNGRRPYWRRVHQLSGVVVCPTHYCRLTETEVPKGFGVRTEVQSAASALEELECKGLPEPEFLNSTSVEVRIATRMSALLMPHVGRRSRGDLISGYEKQAISVGYHTSALRFDRPRFERDVVEYIGPSLLADLSIDGIGEDGNSLLYRQLSKSGIGGGSYLLHVIIQEFIASRSDRSLLIEKIGSGPWRCPNPYCNFKQATENLSVRVSDGNRMRVNAKCSCGYTFSFERSIGNKPIVCHVKKLGETWAQEVRRLRSVGKSRREIASILAISVDTVYALLGEPKVEAKPSQEEVERKRKEWTALRDKFPDRSITKARLAGKALYYWLRRNDAEWFDKDRSGPRVMPECTPERVDWAARDAEWAPRLTQAAAALLEENPTRIIKAATIIRKAQIGTDVFRYSDEYLPQCRLVLDQCSETLHQFWERKLLRTYQLLAERGEVRRWELIREARIGVPRLSAEDKDYVVERANALITKARID